MLGKHPNLYYDLSARNPVFFQVRGRDVPPNIGISGPEWQQLFEDYPDRFMFGLDNYSVESYLATKQIAEYYGQILLGLQPSTAELIAHGNIERILQLDVE